MQPILRTISVPAGSNSSQNVGVATHFFVISTTGAFTVRSENGTSITGVTGRSVVSARPLGVLTFTNSGSAAVSVVFYAGITPLADAAASSSASQEQSSEVGGLSGPQNLANNAQLVVPGKLNAISPNGDLLTKRKQIVVTNLSATLPLKFKKLNHGNVMTIPANEQRTLFTDAQLIILNDATGAAIDFELLELYYVAL